MSVITADQYSSRPYPGRRPAHSYLLDEDRVLAIGTAGSLPTWRLCDGRGQTLVEWLATNEGHSIADRRPLLCYGSNACPGKLLELRHRFALPGPVVMSRCDVVGFAAAWCNGRRSGGEQSIPATLVVAVGREQHFVWWVAPDQWEALDRCEGRWGGWYDVVRLGQRPDRAVLDERGEPIPGVLAYVGACPERRSLLSKEGAPLLVREHDQAAAGRSLAESTPTTLQVSRHDMPVGAAYRGERE